MQRNTLLALSVLALLLLGVIGLVVYQRSVNDFMAVAPGQIEQEEEILEEKEQNEISVEAGPGTYVVYETTTVVDRGERDWANDDTQQVVFSWYRLEDGAREDFARVVRGMEETSGSLIAYPFGTRILVHRYGPSEEDALIEMDGAITLESENWSRLVSKDESVEVTWENTEVEPVAWMYAYRDGVEVSRARIDRETFGIEGAGAAYPVAISDDNKFVYLEKGPYEGPGRFTVWRYDIDAGTMNRISYLDKNDLHEIRINTATNQLIGVEATIVEVLNSMPDLSAPTKIHLVDLVTDTGIVLREDAGFRLTGAFLSADGNQYAYYIAGDTAAWIDAVTDDGMQAQNPVSGSVLGWVGSAMVILHDDNLIVYNPDADEKMVTLGSSVYGYENPDLRLVNFVGVIEIE